MPGDLNLKKSWHPGLMKNQKKLWEQEQEALNEHLKIKARNEELKKEKEKQELIKLQYGDSKDIPLEVKRELNNLNWMYNDSKSNNKSNNEFNDMDDEFLLGKRKVENMLRGNKYIDTQEASRFEETISSGNKGHQNIEQDPLLRIKNEQLKKYKEAKDSSRHSSKDRHSSTHRSSSRSDNSLQDRYRSRDRSPERHSSSKYRSDNKISKLSHSNHRHLKSEKSKLKSSRHHSSEKDSNVTELSDSRQASQRDNTTSSNQFIAY